MKKELIQHVRKPSNRMPYATLFAYQDEKNNIFIGWSKYAKKLEKGAGGVPFSKKVGVKLAKECSERKDIIFYFEGSRKNIGDKKSFIPYNIEKKAVEFLVRIKTYFKKDPVNVNITVVIDENDFVKVQCKTGKSYLYGKIK